MVLLCLFSGIECGWHPDQSPASTTLLNETGPREAWARFCFCWVGVMWCVVGSVLGLWLVRVGWCCRFGLVTLVLEAEELEPFAGEAFEERRRAGGLGLLVCRVAACECGSDHGQCGEGEGRWRSVSCAYHCACELSPGRAGRAYGSDAGVYGRSVSASLSRHCSSPWRDRLMASWDS